MKTAKSLTSSLKDTSLDLVPPHAAPSAMQVAFSWKIPLGLIGYQRWRLPLVPSMANASVAIRFSGA